MLKGHSGASCIHLRIAALYLVALHCMRFEQVQQPHTMLQECQMSNILIHDRISPGHATNSILGVTLHVNGCMGEVFLLVALFLYKVSRATEQPLAVSVQQKGALS